MFDGSSARPLTKAMRVTTASPTFAPVDVTLHIGMGKTGTSSIQTFLNRNRRRLTDVGMLYPVTPGQARHVRLALSVRPEEGITNLPSWRRLGLGTTSPEAFRQRFRRRLRREIDNSGLRRVLFSDEGLYGLSDQALRNLASYMRTVAGNLRVVVYLRRQDDHLVSNYQQLVKVGETRRLAEEIKRPRYARTHDYYARVGAWDTFLQPNELVVRRFERGAFADGSLYQDFLEAVGIDHRADEFDQVKRRNESLDAEAVEFLRFVNLLRSEDPSADVPWGNHELIPQLAEASTGPALTLPGHVLDEYMADCEKSNRRVAVEYLGDETGQLFHEGRKRDNTTTTQYLDPARLDHYLSLLTIPEPLHAPLRTIAEREATSARA